MGYAVYEDRNADRWAGYGVPAVCDWPDCNAEIDRGLDYKCEYHEPEEGDSDDEGCGLFFCPKHARHTDGHAAATPKRDTVEWMQHMLTDRSWKQWRAENPSRVEAMWQALDEAP